MGKVGQQYLSALPSLLGVGFFRRSDEGVIGSRGGFRLGGAMGAPVLPAKNGDQTEHDAADDADTVLLPPFLEILDAFVVGVLIH